jgi:hypothetical protein
MVVDADAVEAGISQRATKVAMSRNRRPTGTLIATGPFGELVIR